MMQGMFRNPLADPGLVGVSSGAALAAVATIALANGLAAPWARALGVYALPFSAFCGGFAASTILVAIVNRQGQLAISTLLLAGIALGAFSAALTGLIAFASDDRELRDLTLWMLGSLSGARWPLRSYQMAAILPESSQGLGNGRRTAAAEAVASRVPSGRRRLPCRCAVALPIRNTSPRPITRDMGVGCR